MSGFVRSRDVSLRVLCGSGSIAKIGSFLSTSIIVSVEDVFDVVGFVPDKASEIMDRNARLILVTSSGSMAPT